MSDINEINIKYDDLTHTTYPKQEDKLIVFRDPSASEILLINQYNALISQGQTVSAIELLKSNPSLMDCIINADKLLSLHHSILAVQRYFYDFVLDKIFRIGNQKGEWNTLMSSNAEDEMYRLNKYDVIRYPVDGISQYFLVIGNNIEAGDIPIENLDNEKYLQVSMKGDKGDTGYTPQKGIDYYDGVNGLGLSPCGAWVNDRAYTQYDLVSHNNRLWYAIENNVEIEPSENSSVWQFIDISLNIVVSEETPQNLSEDGLWIATSDDSKHIIIRTKDNNGEYKDRYPETNARYVYDISGADLQRKIYLNYFERDDVFVTSIYDNTNHTYTSEAKVYPDFSIVVARMVTTDTLDIDGNYTEELTVFDESGESILYYIKQIVTEIINDDGTITYEDIYETVICNDPDEVIENE